MSNDPIRKLTTWDLTRMNVGERYRKCTIDSIPDKCTHKKPLSNWLGRVRKNVENGNGLIFCGEYGTGKTASAVICMKNTVVRGGTAYLAREMNLQNTFIEKPEFDIHETIPERMLSVDLLVIDDIGAGRDNNFGSEILESILRIRSDEKLCTMFTTNLTPSALAKRLKGGILQPVLANTAVIECKGFNFRDLEARKAGEATE